jgi:small subunit ribosomal protein S15
MKYSKETSKIIQDAGLDANDVGSSQAQIALLTDRIRSLTEHVKLHKKDVHSRHGLVKLVSQRRKQLKYLRKTKLDSYDALITKLSIRGL